MVQESPAALARLEGFEPPTFSFEGCRSIHLSYRRPLFSLLQLCHSEKAYR